MVMGRFLKVFCVTLLVFSVHAHFVNGQRALVDSLLNSMESGEKLPPEQALAIAAAYFTVSNDSCEFYARYAYEGLSPQHSDSLKGAVAGYYGLALFENIKLPEAEQYLKEAIETQKRIRDLPGLSSSYNTMGNKFLKERNNLKALDWYEKALEIDKQLDDKGRLAKSYFNLGILYRATRRHEDARQNYHWAIAALREVGDQSSELRALVNLSQLFGFEDTDLYSLDSSIYYGKQAVELAKTLDYDFGVAKAYSMLASPLIRKGYEEPRYLLEGLTASQHANAFFKETRFQWDYWGALLNEGYAHEALGNTSQAKTIAREVQDAGFAVHECYRLFYRALKKEGQYKESLSFFEKYQKVVDSIRVADMENRLTEVQIGFETTKKDQEITNLSQQAEIQTLQIRQRNTWLVGLAALAGILGLIAVVFIQRRNFRHKETVSVIEQKLLRLQMNPHFIFNALSAIQHFVLKSETKEAVRYLAKFSKLMRQILEFSRLETVTLSDEKEWLENYLVIQQLRPEKKFKFRVEIAEGLNPEETMIPPMFAQPFVENAIEHAGLETMENGEIDIRFREEGNQLLLEIDDNGVGIGLENKSNHRSLSTVITKERLALLERKYSTKLQMLISSLVPSGVHQGTRVQVLLPLIPK